MGVDNKQPNVNRLFSQIVLANNPTQFSNIAIHDFGNGNLLEEEQNNMIYIDIIRENGGFTTKHLKNISPNILICEEFLKLYHYMFIYAEEMNYFYNNDKKIIIDIILSQYNYNSNLDSIMQHYDEEPYKYKNTDISIPCIPITMENLNAVSCNIYSTDKEEIYREDNKILNKNEGYISNANYLKTIISPIELVDDKRSASLSFLQLHARVKDTIIII